MQIEYKSRGYSLIYSGKAEDSQHENGVGIIFNNDKRRTLIPWEPISERLIKATLELEQKKIVIVQCYTPTNVSEYQVKMEFYDLLNKTLHLIKEDNLIIIMRDMNSQLESGNRGIENNGQSRIGCNKRKWKVTC